MKSIMITIAGATLLVASAAGAQTVQDNELFPPNAKPGECYTRLFVPPTYETTTNQVVLKEASERIEVVPAAYETVEETVLVKEASHSLQVIPAEYTWAEETVMVKPERKRLIEVPAQYETVTEQVLDTPAHTVWKKGNGPIEKVDNSTGEIMCLIEVPATYKTVSRRVLKSPASTREEVVPAEYKTVRRKVMSKPPTTREIEIPAEYAKVKVTKMVRPATSVSHPIAEERGTVTSRTKVTEGKMAWHSVLCETNTTPDTVAGIQRALKGAGFDPGSIDGQLGSSTLAAVRSFQSSKGLPVGALTIETLRALGL